MSIGSPVVISGGLENPQFASLANISVGLDDPNSFDETLLQELIDATPNVLPIRDYLPSTTAVFSLGREVTVDLGNRLGRIDNLLVTNDGYLVVVETKLYRNPEGVREVIVQTLQYGMAVGKMSLAELETQIGNGQAPSLRRGETIRQCVGRLSAANSSSSLIANDFETALERHLRLGEILLLVVSDEIHLAVERVTDWLNEQRNSAPFKLGLVELKFYTHGADRLVIPRTVLKTREVSRHVVVVDIRNQTAAIVTKDVFNDAEGEASTESRSNKSVSPPLTESQLLQSIADECRPAAVSLLDRLKTYPFIRREATSELQIGFHFPQEGGRFYALAYLDAEGVYVYLRSELRKLLGPGAMVEFHRETNRYGGFYVGNDISKPDSASCVVKYQDIVESSDGFAAFLDAYRTKFIGLLEADETT